MLLNVNIFSNYRAQFIRSLAWYHNGSEIVSGDKYRISNNATTLSIPNMAARDAGTYQAKISSYHYGGGNPSPECDSFVLPLLASLAAFSPVTFTVQEECVPVYDPASIISTHYIRNGSVSRIEISRPVIQLNSSLSSYLTPSWYRNGNDQILYNNENMYNSSATTWESLSLLISSNDTADIIGDYVGIIQTYSVGSDCIFYYYFDLYYYYSFDLPLQVSFWRIALYSEYPSNRTYCSHF